MTRLTNDTISGNAASVGGGIVNPGGPVPCGNTIIAGNTASSAGPDVEGPIDSQGYNLIDNTSGSSGWVVST